MNIKKSGKRTSAEMQRISARPWKRLTQLEKLKGCLAHLVVAGSWADLTLNIDREVLDLAMRHHRGPVDYLFRRMNRQVPKFLGRDVDFFIVGDVDRSGRFHLHGVAGISEDEHRLLKKACWEALGEWDVAARNKQFKIRMEPDFGWVEYITKDPPQFDGNPTSITRDLNARAARGHDLTLSEWNARPTAKIHRMMSLTWAIGRQDRGLNSTPIPRMA